MVLNNCSNRGEGAIGSCHLVTKVANLGLGGDKGVEAGEEGDEEVQEAKEEHQLRGHPRLRR